MFEICLLILNEEMSKVIFIERAREDGAYSVDSIINSTINNLRNKLNVSSFRLKRINSGIINRLVNYYLCLSIRDKNCIYHLSGDSSYLSLVLKKKLLLLLSWTVSPWNILLG